ncbi:MAG: V-type ATP synthase subunit I [Halanaeroarchaeum sp.]
MLRPEQMSKLSVAGTRAVMRDAIEAIHDLDLVHFSDYDGDIEDFDTGAPLEGADAAADDLVTVRSLQSILGVTEADAGPTRIVTQEVIDEELPEIREVVNDLDDRRSALEDDLRAVEERIDTAEPFVELGYDLELLSGYEHLDVAVGEGSAEAVEEALAGRDDVEAYDLATAEDVVAVFVAPTDVEANVLDDALVGVEFERIEIPDASGSPESYVQSLEHDRQTIESKLQSVESELGDYRLEYAGFLLAAEEKLAIDVQKAEIPLQFATTEHAFVAEGWIPTEAYDDLVEAVTAATDDRVEIEQLEVADYREYAQGHHAPVDEAETAADGGVTFDADDEPPVIQDNPSIAKPFELLVETINRPRYSEYDPTLIVLLTFPVFFGFMIGDVGYGLLYTAIGYYLATRMDNDAIRSLGGIAAWSGAFTVLFGILYGEVFGMHLVSAYLWGGHPPMHKGLMPGFLIYAKAWLMATLFVGLLHVTVGYALSFMKDLAHGVTDAIVESGSWAMLMLGLWAWVFSTHAQGGKPPFLFQVFNKPIPGQIPAENVAYAFGFGGFPATVGIAGLAVAVLGLGLLLYGEGVVGALESLNVLVNVLSYTRIAAVLLAKAGMAFVVNLLFFGAYEHGGEFHFMVSESPQHVIEATGHPPLFDGLIHMGVAGVLGGIVILVLGHLIVLALGVTSAGLQAVRLEYVEFFGKFYDGGGAKYEPFGHQRTYTTED